MVVVAGWIDVDAKVRDAYLAARLPAMIATREEPGCIEYVVSPDPVDLERIRLFEIWETKEDLDVHHKLTHSGPLPTAAFEVVGREIIVYEISSSGPF